MLKRVLSLFLLGLLLAGCDVAVSDALREENALLMSQMAALNSELESLRLANAYQAARIAELSQTHEMPELAVEPMPELATEPTPELATEPAPELATGGNYEHTYNPAGAVTIFLSPGHGNQTVAAVEGTGGLIYGARPGNSNETPNMLAVTFILRDKLEAAGFDVVLAREDNVTNPPPGVRTQMARDAGAVFGLSIHSCPSVNEDWYQEVGRYRTNQCNGRTMVFGEGNAGISPEIARRTAERSFAYAHIISEQRAIVENRSVGTRGNIASSFPPGRGLTTHGNTPLELLFSEDIPWVYSEFRSGPDNTMSETDIQNYALGLFNGIMALGLK